MYSRQHTHTHTHTVQMTPHQLLKYYIQYTVYTQLTKLVLIYTSILLHILEPFLLMYTILVQISRYTVIDSEWERTSFSEYFD